MADNKCQKCAKTVYPQETLSVNDRKWHKGCFKCSECSTTLDLKNFIGSNEGGVYKVFCKVHGPKGVGPQTNASKTAASASVAAAPKPGSVASKVSAFTAKVESTNKSSPPVKKASPAVAPTVAKTSPATAPSKTVEVKKPSPAAPANTASNTASNNNSKSETPERKTDAASFLERNRHRVNFESKLTSQQVEDFRKLFTIYDRNKSGTIDIDTMEEVLVKLGYDFSPENMVVIHRIVDENKDGVLNFNEFLGFYDLLDFLKSLFESADKDKSGSIDRRELNILLKRAGYKFAPKQVELLYRMCDEDGSGVLELNDFLSLILFVFHAQILFHNADTDGSDSVELEEFNELLEDLGIDMDPIDVMKFFRDLDSDRSGTLSFEEYIELVFELKYPFISTLVKLGIEATGVSAELEEEVIIDATEKLNLMEASGFIQRSRHTFNFQSKLTPQQVEDFKVLFKSYDRDGSGTIDIIELGSALYKLGYTFSPENIETIVDIVDDNEDGVLNFQEFLGLYDFLEYLKSLFETADDDKGGSIDRAELGTLLEKAGYHFNEKQVELFYKMCDDDDSGVLEISDFFSLTLFIFWAQILFAKADTDGNDSIDIKEFNNALKRLGLLMPPEEVVKFFNDLDKDGSGSLVFEEYIELIFTIKFLVMIFG